MRATQQVENQTSNKVHLFGDSYTRYRDGLDTGYTLIYVVKKTSPAFQTASEMGADGVEKDVPVSLLMGSCMKYLNKGVPVI